MQGDPGATVKAPHASVHSHAVGHGVSPKRQTFMDVQHSAAHEPVSDATSLPIKNMVAMPADGYIKISILFVTLF